MIEKPMHRRRAVLSNIREASGARWLLPGLLTVEAFFVGSTFNTLAATIPAIICAILLVGLLLQWSSGALRAEITQFRDERTNPLVGPGKGPSDPDFAAQVKASQQQARWRLLRWLRSASLLPLSLIVASCGAMFRISHHLQGNLNPMAMFVDMIAHFSFLFSSMLWVYYPRRGHPAMLWFGLILVLMSVTAGGVSHTINGQLVAALATIIGFSFASDYILGRWYSDRARRQRAKRASKLKVLNRNVTPTQPLPESSVSIDSEKGRSGLVYSILALSILLMATSAAGHLVASVVPSVRLEFLDRLSQSLEAVTSNSIIGSSRYVRGSRLGSIRQHMLGDPSEVALRAFAENSPGYLRGTAFDQYRDGGWGVVNDRNYAGTRETSPLLLRQMEIEGSGQTALNGRSTFPLQRFYLRKNPEGDLLGTIEVHNVPEKGTLVFTSLSTNWVEAVSYQAAATHHDVIVKGVDTRNPYVLSVNTETPREQLEPIRKEILLQVPPRLKQHLNPIVADVCEGRLTARSKARALEDYFERGFSYSLRETAVPSEIDPVVHFLKSKHPAHCEYFATAATLLLRSAGVPARYVTGYVVKEHSEDDSYWLGRNRDAHAWVEAYDDISERWFPVEPTVGRTYHTLLTADEIAEQAEGREAGFLDLEDDRTVLGRILGWLFSFRTADSLTLIFRVAQLPLFCMLLVLLWVRHRQKQRANEDSNEVQSRQMLQRVDRRMKRFSLVRAPNETLHQFAKRVEAAARRSAELEPQLRRVADWYRSFAEARYRGKLPEPLAEV